MTTRRDLLQYSAAVAAALAGTGLGGGTIGRALAQQRVTEADLLAFEPLGNVTILHVTDIHAQLKPVYFREPTVNLGVGEAKGVPPHVTGKALLEAYKVPPGSPLAYALADIDFEALAKSYGRVGGLDRVATVVEAVRAERGDRVLLLDGGDTWQNSFTSLATKGQDMVDCMALLKPDAMTAHWEFTLGAERVKALVDTLGFPFLCQNVRESEFQDEVFKGSATFERGGVKIAVIGQALPYTPIANPRWMIPDWSFGIREKELQAEVDKARAGGAGLVVLLSHNGFDVDRKLAGRVNGIDVILTGHTHDALPAPVQVGKTLLIASGSHGKFVSRLDLDVRDGAVRGVRHKLIPVMADAIRPNAAVAAAIAKHRAPHEAMLAEVVGRTETTLYRRGNFNGTLDDVICDALLAERDAEIALSPGFRWGPTLLPGQSITREDVYNATAMTYPAAYRMAMTGGRLKEILEDVADNIFNPDPYLQQGGDMVRVGGLSYTIDVGKPIGSRIGDLVLARTGQPLAADKDYTVAGWASVNEGTEGPAIWDVVFSHLKKTPTVAPTGASTVKILGA
ncbi:thiosulfohydrolase SoxB [Rhodoplanes sp. TEM]|uniref:Thiosulfohydrolase SoxB n=1 Tax=Rhodoplanes tepidamans TaxID=200616 RepID=A0ABT5JJQ5_RHOTP|nr:MULTISPECIES: thiosulfohydrolase SoxB [Rhodoplanes]MDC7789943.1 thiosulfohydrolase SoxB [Rhodoplanes tepidamans]MDC7986776.1 thiosulfohydrolase SoxB [Rhodoplanes sp. TEM]MDQ0357744.1 sulfur-oxidizing protein SoxB [Rhodoplanes tepidamans]